MKDQGHGPRRVPTDVIKEDSLQLPAQLDEDSIASYLKLVSRTSPEQLPGTFRAIREVWAHRMGGWVARGRLDYLNTVLQQLTVSHQIVDQCLQMDAALDTHRDLKQERADKRKAGVSALKAEAEAEELRVRIEAARAQQAEDRKKRDEFLSPPQREATQEERRQQSYKTANDKVSRLIIRRDERLQETLRGRKFEELSPDEQDEYRADENMYNERIRAAKEERLKFE